MGKRGQKRPRADEVEEEDSFNHNSLDIEDEFVTSGGPPTGPPIRPAASTTTSRPPKRIHQAAGEGGSRRVDRTVPMDR